MQKDSAQLFLRKLTRPQERHRAVHTRFVDASPFSIATSDSVGVLRLYVASTGASPEPKAAFRIQCGTELVPNGLGTVQEQLKWLCTPWTTFEVFPGRPSCILLSLTHSKDILTAELPLSECHTCSIHVFTTLPGDVACFIIANGGSFVLSGDANGGLQTWCAIDGGAISARAGAHSGKVTCLAFVEPSLAVSGGADGQVKTWIVQAGRLEACQQLHATGAPIRSLAVHASSSHHQSSAGMEDISMPHVRSPSCGHGLIAAGTSAGELLAWQLHGCCCSERVFSVMLVPGGGITTLCFSLDGSTLCVGSGQQYGNVWLFSTSSWSSRRLRGGFGSAVVACHFPQTPKQMLFVCTTEGLQPTRSWVPEFLEAAPDSFVEHHQLARTEDTSGGRIKALGLKSRTIRELPPVPNFLEPFMRDALGMQGWEAPVPALAWGGNSTAGNASIDVAPLNLSLSAPSAAHRIALQPAAIHRGSHMRQTVGAPESPAGPDDDAEETLSLLAPAVCHVSNGSRQVAVQEVRACKPAFVDPADAEEQPLPLLPALRALALQQRCSATTEAAESTATAVPVESRTIDGRARDRRGSAADVACPVSTAGQQAQSAHTKPQAQPVPESTTEAGKEVYIRTPAAAALGRSPCMDNSSQGGATGNKVFASMDDELEHPWDQASSSVLSSRCQSGVSCHRDTEGNAATQPSVSVAECSADTADSSQGPWTQQDGQEQMAYIPAARMLEASRGDVDTKVQTISTVLHQVMLPGMTAQQVRQLRSQSAACQDEAIAKFAKAEAIMGCLERLRSAQPPVAASVATPEDIEERARAYAASAATLPKHVHKYHGLVTVEASEAPAQAERLVRKQLRPGWEARWAARPCLDSAWPMRARKDLSVGAGKKPPVFEVTALGVAEAALRA